MSEKKIRVGIIGCGMITQRSHAPRFAEIPGVEITALCDLDKARMEAVQAAHAPGAALFTDYEELLQARLVDAVSIATPVHLHYPMTIAALETGCHVLCEKPMAMSQIQTRKMVVEAEAVGSVLQINLSCRYAPFYQTIARLLAEGALGEIRRLRAIRVHTTAPDQGWSPGATWFVTHNQGGGIVGDIGVHVGDMMQWYGGPVASVSAFTTTIREDIDVVDNATALFHFASGATGVLELSWTSPINHFRFEIHGSEAVLSAGAPAEGILIRPRTGEPRTIAEAEFDPSRGNSFECFINAINGQAPTPVPGATGHEIQLVLDAILASGEQGGAPIEITRR